MSLSENCSTNMCSILDGYGVKDIRI